jgi:hypothetical protein
MTRPVLPMTTVSIVATSSILILIAKPKAVIKVKDLDHLVMIINILSSSSTEITSYPSGC